MSLHNDSYDSVVEDAVNYAVDQKVVVFSISGNAKAGNTEDEQTVDYPGAYANCIAVGALSPCNDRKKADPVSCDGDEDWSSNYGPGLDFLAPGVGIYSTKKGGGSRYGFNGTSFASPYAVGVAALMLSINPNLTPTQIKNILCSTAVSIGTELETGCGRIDAQAAVQEVYDNYVEHVILSNRASNDLLLGGELSLRRNELQKKYVVNSQDQKELPVILQEYCTAETFERSGIDGKYHLRWNSGSDYLFVWDNFRVENEYVNLGINAYYEERDNITITSDFEQNFSISDPWWIDPATGEQHTNPVFHEIGNEGNYSLFLNQYPDPQNPNQPYYSIAAQKHHATSDAIYEFSHWQATPANSATFQNENSRQTPVVFKQGNATVTAVYALI
jgi:hypothetical protein